MVKSNSEEPVGVSNCASVQQISALEKERERERCEEERLREFFVKQLSKFFLNAVEKNNETCGNIIDVDRIDYSKNARRLRQESKRQESKQWDNLQSRFEKRKM